MFESQCHFSKYIKVMLNFVLTQSRLSICNTVKWTKSWPKKQLLWSKNKYSKLRIIVICITAAWPLLLLRERKQTAAVCLDLGFVPNDKRYSPKLEAVLDICIRKVSQSKIFPVRDGNSLNLCSHHAINHLLTLLQWQDDKTESAYTSSSYLKSPRSQISLWGFYNIQYTSIHRLSLEKQWKIIQQQH